MRNGVDQNTPAEAAISPREVHRASLVHDLNNFLSAALTQIVNAEAEHPGVELTGAKEALLSAGGIVQRLAKIDALPAHAGRGAYVLDAEKCFRDIAHLLTRPGEAVVHVRVPRERVALEIPELELKQILMNLVVNALEAGAQMIALSLDLPRTGGRAFIRVTDDGGGMSPAVRARIFEPFFSTKERNHGLGLSGVRAIVERCGGSVDVESSAGMGTAFTLRLPVRSASNGVILVVDNEPRVAQVVSRILTRAGYRTLVATSRREALAAVEKCQGKLLAAFVDADLDGASGTALASELKSAVLGVRTILMSGQSVEWARGTPLLLKPFQAHDLLVLLRGTLERAESQPPPDAKHAMGA